MLDSFLCDQFLYSHNKTTNLVYCKEKIDVDKLAGAERVKEWLVHSVSITVYDRST